MEAVASFGSAARFAIVGCTNFLVSAATFYVCFRYLPPIDLAAAPWLSGSPGIRAPAAAVANVIAYAAGMVNSFVLNRAWTFGVERDAERQAVRFAVLNLASLVASTVIVYRFVDVLGFPELAVWVPLTLIVMIVNYLGCRHWVFTCA